MILVDASVIIDYLRTPSPDILAVMQTSGAVICGVTRAEILAGSRHAQQRHRLTSLLDSLGQIVMDDWLWDAIGDHLATLRRAGVTVPFPDAVLSTLAITWDMTLWTRDQHFLLIQKVIPELKLYQKAE